MRGEIYSGIPITAGPVGSGDNSAPPQPDSQGLARQYTGTPLIDQLSDRERDVFVLVAHGHTNQQIADRLFLSVKTIESYRTRLMAKLGLKDRSELTRFALECGLLDGGRPDVTLAADAWSNGREPSYQNQTGVSPAVKTERPLNS